jgi:P-type E1-E2 ATPase
MCRFVVVSVPDGLPITIGVSLAFSVMKMFNQKILVRKLDAPENMSGIQEICCGKTGTLTNNDMKVVQFFCENRLIINNRKDTLLQCELQQDSLIRIQESILYNCDARV